MKILSNLYSKIPKICLILAIMAGLSIHHNSFFGIKEAAPTTEQNIAQGYAGPVPVIVEVDQNGLIDTVKLGANDETARFVEHVIGDGFLDTWDGMTIDQAAASTPDAISGATYTSSAIAQNVRTQAATMGAQSAAAIGCATDWMAGQIAIAIIVLMAIICYLMPSKTKKLRIPLLIASVVVLGFWQGAFVSFDLLYNWLVNGSQITQIALAAIVILSIGIPLLLNKSFYCTHICPFGAMQELAGKFPTKKIAVKPKTLRIFRYIKQAILVTFVVLIFVVPTFQPSSWEPFTAFIFTSAAIWSIIIAVISLIASIFIPRAWCRLLCPTGEFLALLQRKQKF